LAGIERRQVIAADTSTWVAFFEGEAGQDGDLLDRALAARQVIMPPVVLAELLSNPDLPTDVAEVLCGLPLMEIKPGYWQRAGALRASVLAKRRKARLGDSLIAQSCLDHSVPLLTRDRDFHAFSDAAGLDVIVTLGSR
jgi:predicted nucleic acid-binding protein